MADEEKMEKSSLTLDKKSADILVTNIIPTSSYFEARFDLLQVRLDGVKNDLKDFKEGMERRFDDAKSDMSTRFEDVKSDTNRRFEQVEKRFEQMDRRLLRIAASIDRIGDKPDFRDENNGASQRACS